MPSGVGLIDVGARCEQRAHAARAARARRVQERVSPPTGRYCARGSDVICESQSLAEARTFTSAPWSIKNCVSSGKLPSTAQISAVWSAPGFFRVDVGAALDEQLRDVERADARREHQRRLAVAVRRFDVGAGVEQLLDQSHVAELHGFGERARAVLVRDVGFGAALEQLRDELAVDLVDRPVQRRRAVALRRVDVGARRVNRLERSRALAVLDQIRERRLRVRCRACDEHRAGERQVFHTISCDRVLLWPQKPLCASYTNLPGRSTSGPCLP